MNTATDLGGESKRLHIPFVLAAVLLWVPGNVYAKVVGVGISHGAPRPTTW